MSAYRYAMKQTSRERRELLAKVERMGVEDALMVQEWLQSQRSGHQEKDNDTSEDSDETTTPAKTAKEKDNDTSEDTSEDGDARMVQEWLQSRRSGHRQFMAPRQKAVQNKPARANKVKKDKKDKKVATMATKDKKDKAEKDVNSKKNVVPKTTTKPAARMIFPVPPKDPPPLRLLLAPYSTATVRWLGNKVQEALKMKQHKMLEMKLVDKGLISPLQKLDRQAEVGAEGEQKKEPIEQRLVINKHKLEQKLLDIKHHLRCSKLAIKQQPEVKQQVKADQKHPLPVPVGPPVPLGGA